MGKSNLWFTLWGDVLWGWICLLMMLVAVVDIPQTHRIYWRCGGLRTHEVLDGVKSWKMLKELLHLLGEGQTLNQRVSLQHSSKIYWCMSIMKNTIAFFGTIFLLKSLTVPMLSHVFSYLASECSVCLQPYSVAHSSSKEWYVATQGISPLMSQ